MFFLAKSILKNNRYHTLKYLLKVICNKEQSHMEKNPPMLLQKQGSAIIKATLNNLFY
jgi:hypothetical protein